jgi:uncharacterized protein YqgC (DUF456 family)
VFLILGVLGLFLPVLQGILFIIMGLLILAPESRRIRKLLVILRKKYPAVFKHADRLKRKYTRSGTGHKDSQQDTPGAVTESRFPGNQSGVSPEQSDK